MSAVIIAEAYGMAMRALRIMSREKIYLDWQTAWEALPHDIAGTSAWYVGLKDEAIQQFQKALQYEPNNDRLKENLKLCLKLVAA